MLYREVKKIRKKFLENILTNKNVHATIYCIQSIVCKSYYDIHLKQSSPIVGQQFQIEQS